MAAVAATTPAKDIDYEAIGLWDDGPCDDGQGAVEDRPDDRVRVARALAGDQALALEASAEAFNARGGANGACIEVTTCDDGANLDQAVACATRSTTPAWSRPSTTRAQPARPRCRRPWPSGDPPRRVERHQDDWGDQNAYPLDASGTGVTFLMPRRSSKKAHRDRPHPGRPGAAPRWSASSSRSTRTTATFPYDVPVPGGTTDFTQFILAAEEAGADGVALALGEQEAVQVVKGPASSSAPTSSSGPAWARSRTRPSTELGDFAEQMVFLWSFPPATIDLPVYEALRTTSRRPARRRSSPRT